MPDLQSRIVVVEFEDREYDFVFEYDPDTNDGHLFYEEELIGFMDEWYIQSAAESFLEKRAQWAEEW